ncbi:thiamine phosphate synthase [Methylobacterium sp. 77]|uniref:thiamine phosphate synthase n=1 Tax=Methylobacterium sp. 77 TaxID=1101192 RepID=UPI0003648608|nr:thiamine phosphate synthase [Methylobacterium sp. 77]
MIGRDTALGSTVPVDLRLYGILDVDVCGDDGADLAEMAAEAVSGGCTLLQYREKAIGNARESLARIRAIKEAITGTGVPLLVNDRCDLALAAETEGVHLGQSDLHPVEARHILGPRSIIGLTLKSGPQADELYRLPVDYACIGGVFATTSKDNPDPPVGLDGFSRIAFRARLARGTGFPVGAIAGIDGSNAAAVIVAGADGIAVISALFSDHDVEARASDLRHRVDSALAARGVTR